MPKQQDRKIVRRQGEAVTTITTKRGEEPEKTFQRREIVDDLPEHPAYVKVEGGLTKSLAPYESARMGVSISVPCHTHDAAIRKTYKRVSDLVGELLECEYEKIMDT